MTVRWGMLSTASIGRVVAEALRGSAEAQFVTVAGRDRQRAAAYANELGLPRSAASYDELLADDEVDAVYIPLPVALHTEWTIRALRAGKHVLCEKPFAMTAADAAACFDAAEAAGKLCVEGLMWRHHPHTALVRQLLADGAIGRLLFIRAALSVDVPPGDIRRTGRLGGGALLDLGCYCVSAIRLFGGQPLRVRAEQVVDAAEGADGSDLRLAATLALPGDVLGQFDVALDYPRRDELELIGSEGIIRVPDPWICRVDHVELERGGAVKRLPVAGEDPYRLEFVLASRAIATGTPPAFGRADAIEQAAALEAVRAAAGANLRP
ncbi:Gfo/Idh/MocA family oxidoreductase [Actinoplanes sp. Pm04-4]|uniref:Gfo/Idh/MocA family oxidoreductase n=1 Tax=Paractinoplanes pyxinae TaxID=2997416 RepID=A0ABT4AZY0_9ACTN|nr:Gfo/Idh/MocA family oxidoreductase [Actinoplanes pyxinae]MCY1138913.1 Gfo/Idh/MocA family oxidoreductase [Actinoplanes pyxinae]